MHRPCPLDACKPVRQVRHSGLGPRSCLPGDCARNAGPGSNGKETAGN
uniref:Uncharacterized protein n=1 Tax=Arundo donax TaxID=35708 RepID=A0A0A9FJJ2_ARUDO